MGGVEDAAVEKIGVEILCQLPSLSLSLTTFYY